MGYFKGCRVAEQNLHPFNLKIGAAEEHSESGGVKRSSSLRGGHLDFPCSQPLRSSPTPTRTAPSASPPTAPFANSTSARSATSPATTSSRSSGRPTSACARSRCRSRARTARCPRLWSTRRRVALTSAASCAQRRCGRVGPRMRAAYFLTAAHVRHGDLKCEHLVWALSERRTTLYLHDFDMATVDADNPSKLKRSEKALLERAMLAQASLAARRAEPLAAEHGGRVALGARRPHGHAVRALRRRLRAAAPRRPRRVCP